MACAMLDLDYSPLRVEGVLDVLERQIISSEISERGHAQKARGLNYQTSRNKCPLKYRYWYFIRWYRRLDLPPENCFIPVACYWVLWLLETPRRNNWGKTIAWAKRQGYASPPTSVLVWWLIFLMPYTIKSHDSPVIFRMWTSKRFSAEIHFWRGH